MTPRGLRHIRTLTTLRRRPAAPVGHGPPRYRPPLDGPRAPAAAPRTWLFLQGRRFARYQGQLQVEPQARPAVDVFTEDGALLVLAELPGAREEDLEVRLHGDVLVLQARPGRRGGRRYYGEVVLPVSPAGPLRQALRNGILEVEIQIAQPKERKSE